MGVYATASAKISADNQTGAKLMIKVVGIDNSRKYNFAITDPGTKIFNVVPGKYKITISTTGCPGTMVKIKTLNARSSTPLGAFGCG